MSRLPLVTLGVTNHVGLLLLPRQRKRAAGESDSDWSEDDESGDEGGGDGKKRTQKWNRFTAAMLTKENEFAEVLKEMMTKRQQAQPGVLQGVSLGLLSRLPLSCRRSGGAT